MSTTNELPPGLTETNRDREMAWSIDVQADPYAIDSVSYTHLTLPTIYSV